jgi:hypothetical protein
MCGEDAILQIFFDSKKSARRPLWGSARQVGFLSETLGGNDLFDAAHMGSE